ESVVAEVTVARPGREDQIVVVESDALSVRRVDEHASAVYVDTDGLAEDHRGVELPSQNVANRRGDLPGAQDRRRNLIQERLEKGGVLAIDPDEPDIGGPGALRRRQSARSHPPRSRRAAPNQAWRPSIATRADDSSTITPRIGSRSGIDPGTHMMTPASAWSSTDEYLV